MDAGFEHILRQVTVGAGNGKEVLMDLRESPGGERHYAGPRSGAVMRLVCAGLLLCLTSPFAYAQNAAQRVALAKLTGLSPNGGSSSSVEATNVSLNRPGGLAFDAAGNLYIADTDNNVIREVNLQGVITTVAGTGEQGFGGDSGAATSALLDSPAGVAVDANGNLYIADTHNNRIREISNGVITTIAGTGTAGFAGDGGAATSAQLNYPTAIAVDTKGNLYVADTNNFRIREISGTTISTVAGDGEQNYSGDGSPAASAGLDSPSGIAVDSAFNLYIGDTHNQRVRMVTFATGIINTLAGTGVKTFTSDGTATSAALARPRGVAVDSSGNVYVADSDNDRVRMISGGAISTIAGNGMEGFSGDEGSSTNASLDTPRAVAAAGSSVVFADTNNNQVRTVVSSTLNTIAGSAANGKEWIAISGASSAVYGTGTLTATFSNGGQTGTGTVTFFDGEGASPLAVGTAALSSNTAILNTAQLAAGTHYLIASYGGDVNDPAIVSGVFVYTVTPAPLVAVATGVNMLYGQSVPALTGALTGVLAQDAGNVSTNFTTTASMTSPPGTYPIAVQLAGSAAGNYTVTLGSGSGSVVITQAPSITTLTASSSTPVLGTNLTLTATVASTTSGTPAGTVNFYSGTTLLNAAPVTLSSGIATLTVSSLPVGSYTLTATYSGGTDFLASSSSNVPGTVLSPDFTVGASPSVQTVLPSQSVQYAITLTPANATFLYPVALSVTGLPQGVTASFNPASVAAGAGISNIVLTLAAAEQARTNDGPHPYSYPWSHAAGSMAISFLLMPFLLGRRMRRAGRKLSRATRALLLTLALGLIGLCSGCGGGGFFDHANNTYTVTVTAASGPDTHTTNVTLTIE